VKFKTPDRAAVRQVVDEQDLHTVAIPVEDAELNETQLEDLKGRIPRVKDDSGESRSFFFIDHKRAQNGDDVAEVCSVDISLLAKMAYEHRRYAQARGFSDAEMDILRAVEFHDATRVGVDEVIESAHADDYAESTVYKSLKSLQDKQLVEKIRPGVYRYVGP
jgi:hypothetical protein